MIEVKTAKSVSLVRGSEEFGFNEVELGPLVEDEENKEVELPAKDVAATDILSTALITVTIE